MIFLPVWKIFEFSIKAFPFIMSAFPLPINLVATPAAVLIAWKILVPAIKAFALVKIPIAAVTILPRIGINPKNCNSTSSYSATSLIS